MEALLGDRVIVDLGSRAVAVISDVPSAAFTPLATHEVRLTPGQSVSKPRRAVVELRRFHGGLAPRVLLGARFEPGFDDLLLRVGEGAPSARKRSCSVRLGGRKLIAGLPHEFVEPVVSGLTRTLELGAGVITLDRAGVDPVETSPIIVELAAELLGRVMLAPVDQLVDGQLRGWLEALP